MIRGTLSCAAVALVIASGCSDGQTSEPAPLATSAPATAVATTVPTVTVAATTIPVTTVPETTVAPTTTVPVEVDPLTSMSPAEITAAVADRPYTLFVPSTYRPARELPLVLLLHGYTSDSEGMESYWGFEWYAEHEGFLYVRPDGTRDVAGQQYWNAGPSCCGDGRDELAVDDSTYLRAVIKDVAAKFAVDRGQVYVVGHSNGGFMAARLACDHADAIAAVANIAGASPTDLDSCTPAGPVSMAHLHGDADDLIRFDGGTFGNDPSPYLGAVESATAWAHHNGCSGSAVETAVYDFDRKNDGNETDVTTFGPCENGAAVELWTMNGVGHVPFATEFLTERVLEFVLSHPKP